MYDDSEEMLPAWTEDSGLLCEIYIEMSGVISRFTRVLFELPCYPQFELEIHIV